MTYNMWPTKLCECGKSKALLAVSQFCASCLQQSEDARIIISEEKRLIKEGAKPNKEWLTPMVIQEDWSNEKET